MKVNLLFNSNDVRNGYLNIDPLGQEGDSQKVIASVFNLDNLVDDAEAVEILALEIVDRIPIPQVASVIGHWMSKIRRGGTLALGGINLPSVTKAFYRKEIDLATMNKMLFGPQDVPANIKRNALDITWIEDVFKSEGFKIIQSRLENFHYYVKAERM